MRGPRFEKYRPAESMARIPSTLSLVVSSRGFPLVRSPIQTPMNYNPYSWHLQKWPLIGNTQIAFGISSMCFEAMPGCLLSPLSIPSEIKRTEQYQDDQDDTPIIIPTYSPITPPGWCLVHSSHRVFNRLVVLLLPPTLKGCRRA